MEDLRKYMKQRRGEEEQKKDGVNMIGSEESLKSFNGVREESTTLNGRH